MTIISHTNITAAPQIIFTDTSSANANITAATQIPLTDTSSANTNTTAATRLNVTQFLDPSRRTRHCGEPYGGTANGCGHLRTVATANAKLGEHSLTPRPPSETGTLATHSGKNTCLSSQKNVFSNDHVFRNLLASLCFEKDVSLNIFWTCL